MGDLCRKKSSHTRSSHGKGRLQDLERPRQEICKYKTNRYTTIGRTRSSE